MDFCTSNLKWLKKKHGSQSQLVGISLKLQAHDYECKSIFPKYGFSLTSLLNNSFASKDSNQKGQEGNCQFNDLIVSTTACNSYSDDWQHNQWTDDL